MHLDAPHEIGGDGRVPQLPNLLTFPPQSNPANPSGPQTMPECRINKSNAPSSLGFSERAECKDARRKIERNRTLRV